MTPATRVVSCRATARDAMLAHARKDAPRECCGLLAGRGRRIDLAIPLRNVDRRPRVRFRIDPAEHIGVRRALRALSPALDIVGVYHSHPKGPGVPSAADIEASNYPDWFFVVIDSRREAVRVFQIRNGRTLLWRVRWRRPGPRRRRPAGRPPR